MGKVFEMRFCLAILFSAVLMAQSAADMFRKAPPEIDAALRERIALFYKLHGEGKFRQAEELVAPDTKEFFYNSNKPKYLSCEIKKIDYSGDFTDAKALVVAALRVPFPGFGNEPVNMPHISRWKLVDGQWFWWVDPEEAKMTPFGKMDTADPDAPKGPAPNLAAAPNVRTVMNQVGADKTAVNLKAVQGAEDSVRVANRMPGVVKLALSHAAPEGLEVSIKPAEVKANSLATVTFRVTDPAKAPKRAVVNLVVQPVGKIIPVTVTTGG
jgi:hypothetical protein